MIQVLGRFLEIVIADDPLRFAKPRDAGGDVFFQIDILHAGDDCLPQQHEAIFLAFGPAPAVFFAAASDDHRAGPLREQALEIRRRHQKIQPQLDELAALLGQMLVLGDQMAMSAAADRDAQDRRFGHFGSNSRENAIVSSSNSQNALTVRWNQGGNNRQFHALAGFVLNRYDMSIAFPVPKQPDFQNDQPPRDTLEIVNQAYVRGPFRCAVFDFDGTLSLLRGNWQGLMVPMMVEALAATANERIRAELTARSSRNSSPG